MPSRVNHTAPSQLALGLVLGFFFGFLLQRGGVTYYDVILGQLLLEDWTVLKVMGSAIITGMLGVQVMRQLGWVELHPKPGSLGSTVAGGLIFGVGFGLLGYCPGTALGAVGHGALNALVAGVGGMLLGAGLYSVLYPRLRESVLPKGGFGAVTLPELLGIHPLLCSVIVSAILAAGLGLLEYLDY